MGATTSVERREFETRGEVIREILSTEELYTQRLQKLQTYFQIPLEDKAKASKRQQVIPPEKVAALFGNIKKIYRLHADLLSDLQIEDEKDTNSPDAEAFPRKILRAGGIKLTKRNIGTIFLQHDKEFKTEYYAYVNNYQNALLTLLKCERRARFRKFLDKATKQAGYLGDFLLLPVLRIVEYGYLLEELVAKTSSSHPDFNASERAYANITNVAEYINDARRKAENIHALYLVQQKFVDKLMLISDHRILLREGDMSWQKKGKKDKLSKPKNVHYFLFNDMILFAKPARKKLLRPFFNVDKNYKLEKHFLLPKTKMKALPATSSNANQVELTADKETYRIQMRSKEEQKNQVALFNKTATEAALFYEVWPAESFDIFRKKSTPKGKGLARSSSKLSLSQTSVSARSALSPRQDTYNRRDDDDDSESDFTEFSETDYESALEDGSDSESSDWGEDSDSGSDNQQSSSSEEEQSEEEEREPKKVKASPRRAKSSSEESSDEESYQRSKKPTNSGRASRRTRMDDSDDSEDESLPLLQSRAAAAGCSCSLF